MNNTKLERSLIRRAMAMLLSSYKPSHEEAVAALELARKMNADEAAEYECQMCVQNKHDECIQGVYCACREHVHRRDP